MTAEGKTRVDFNAPKSLVERADGVVETKGWDTQLLPNYGNAISKGETK